MDSVQNIGNSSGCDGRAAERDEGLADGNIPPVLSTRFSNPLAHMPHTPARRRFTENHFSAQPHRGHHRGHWGRFRASIESHLGAARQNVLQRFSRTFRAQGDQALEIVNAALSDLEGASAFQVPVVPLRGGTLEDSTLRHIAKLPHAQTVVYLDSVRMGGSTYYELGLSRSDLVGTGEHLNQPVLIVNPVSRTTFIVHGEKLLTHRREREQALHAFRRLMGKAAAPAHRPAKLPAPKSHNF